MSGHTEYPIKAEAVSDPISHKHGDECWIFITLFFWIEMPRYIWRLYNLRNNLTYPAHGNAKLRLPAPTITSCPKQTTHSSHCLLHPLCSTELSCKIKATRKQNWNKLMRMQIMSFVIRSFVFLFHSLLHYSLSSFCVSSSSFVWFCFKSVAKLWITHLHYAILRQIISQKRPGHLSLASLLPWPLVSDSDIPQILKESNLLLQGTAGRGFAPEIQMKVSGGVGNQSGLFCPGCREGWRAARGRCRSQPHALCSPSWPPVLPGLGRQCCFGVQHPQKCKTLSVQLWSVNFCCHPRKRLNQVFEKHDQPRDLSWPTGIWAGAKGKRWAALFSHCCTQRRLGSNYLPRTAPICLKVQLL